MTGVRALTQRRRWAVERIPQLRACAELESLANASAPCGLTSSSVGRAGGILRAATDQNLMQGWGNRRNEWQFGLGIQHEVLPRLSVELTYNRRKYGNLTETETVNQGCDYYGTEGRRHCRRRQTCVTSWLKNYTDPTGSARLLQHPRPSIRVCPTVAVTWSAG